MKKYLVILSIMSVIFLFSGCTQKGTFKDRAAVKQAERAIKKIRNSLEEYYVEHGHYPNPANDLGEELKPYFLKTIRIPDPKDPDKYEEKLKDEWPDLTKESFLEGIVHYETPDTMTTYFIWAQAKDVNNTVVCAKPVKIKTEKKGKK